MWLIKFINHNESDNTSVTTKKLNYYDLNWIRLFNNESKFESNFIKSNCLTFKLSLDDFLINYKLSILKIRLRITCMSFKISNVILLLLLNLMNFILCWLMFIACRQLLHIHLTQLHLTLQKIQYPHLLSSWLSLRDLGSLFVRGSVSRTAMELIHIQLRLCTRPSIKKGPLLSLQQTYRWSKSQ